MQQTIRFTTLVISFLLAGLLLPPAFAQSANLDQLHSDYSMHYLEPDAHMALAKFHLDKGNRLQAFYILETARRGRFEEAVFNQAFNKWFGTSDAPAKYNETEIKLIDEYENRIKDLYEKNPARAKVLLAEAVARFPSEGGFRLNLGALLQQEGNLQEAEVQLVKSAEVSPNDSYIQAWVGRFFFKAKKDDERALNYYLNAYFLDPHAYESEFVESRIRTINWEAATARFEQLLKGGAPVTKIMQDPNPTVVLQAVMRASGDWRPEYLSAMLAMMEHEDEDIRWQATEAIKNHVDRSFDEQLRALLLDKDQRKRGLAAYIAVHLWKQESFAAMRAMFREKAQLLRYDAISALMIEGGAEGRRVVLEHLPNETNPMLKSKIEASIGKRLAN